MRSHAPTASVNFSTAEENMTNEGSESKECSDSSIGLIIDANAAALLLCCPCVGMGSCNDNNQRLQDHVCTLEVSNTTHGHARAQAHARVLDTVPLCLRSSPCPSLNAAHMPDNYELLVHTCCVQHMPARTSPCPSLTLCKHAHAQAHARP